MSFLLHYSENTDTNTEESQTFLLKMESVKSQFSKISKHLLVTVKILAYVHVVQQQHLSCESMKRQFHHHLRA